MIKSVPIDYMHAVCLGEMKRLLKFWVRGKQSTRIPLEKCDAANVELNNLRDSFPSEFVSLIHLPCYAKIHGCLDNFSDFKYENYLGLLKKSISHSRFPLQEAAKCPIE
ncbi:hypothetical protein QTP88_013975 [Uroleucon formosanum]